VKPLSATLLIAELLKYTPNSVISSEFDELNFLFEIAIENC